MTIKPIQPGPPERGGSRKVGEGAPAPAADPRADEKARAQARPAPADNVEVSSAAHELHEAVGAGEIPSGTLPAERLAEISKRIASGHYDSDAVRDDTVRGIAEDLERGQG
jgi:anti-sigma28 factor (negative regulator of flagellin synthesis)